MLLCGAFDAIEIALQLLNDLWVLGAIAVAPNEYRMVGVEVCQSILYCAAATSIDDHPVIDY